MTDANSATDIKQTLETRLEPGLYIVATPIGNLGDITLRAIETLRNADIIACEDSRVTSKLLRHLAIRKPLHRYDDHSTDRDRDHLLGLMASKAVALVSDAGTPLISDPGFKLVRDARDEGIAVTALPGPCAAVMALSIAGLPTDRFMFVGFLPPKAQAKATALEALSALFATLVFYESGPRLADTLSQMDQALPGRMFAVARELTKLHEECRRGTAAELSAYFRQHPPKGEIVLVAGPPNPSAAPVLDEVAIDALLIDALEVGSTAKAASNIAKSTGLDRRALYQRASALARLRPKA